MAAANAQIGVAKAAFFPSLTLTPSIGWESTQFASLFSAPTLMWTLGATVGQVLFDGGLRAANVKFASEGYKATEATYRQTVLNAFQQVQDGITGLSVLDGAAKQSHEAVIDAQRRQEHQQRPADEEFFEARAHAEQGREVRTEREFERRRRDVAGHLQLLAASRTDRAARTRHLWLIRNRIPAPS